VEPGTNQKFPEPIDTNMVSEIEAQQLPPELPLMFQTPTPRPTVLHPCTTWHGRVASVAIYGELALSDPLLPVVAAFGHRDHEPSPKRASALVHDGIYNCF
jgi:hypothetical protein